MSVRTSSSNVQGILLGNYDGISDLTPFIATASSLVDDVSTYIPTGAPNFVALSGDRLELIERWLAAHFYCINDPLYMSKSTGGASGSFQRGQASEGFDTTDFGRMAVRLDTTGYLNTIGKRQTAGAFWAGKPPSQQIPYDQRD